MKYIFILCLISLATFASGKPSCVGCVTEDADLKKSEEILSKSLSKLAAGDGPFYELVKINSASTQVVSGSLDIINADLKDQSGNIKTCDVEILSQSWKAYGITVTFDCPGENKVVKKQSA